MKRVPFLILLSAIAGAIGLPIMMVTCATVAHLGFPRVFGSFSMNFDVFVMSTNGQLTLITGAVLGISSVILWRGERTLWVRLQSTTCSAVVVTFCAWTLKEEHGGFGTLVPLAFWADVAFCFPLILWALALFFFAILMRPKAPQHP